MIWPRIAYVDPVVCANFHNFLPKRITSIAAVAAAA